MLLVILSLGRVQINDTGCKIQDINVSLRWSSVFVLMCLRVPLDKKLLLFFFWMTNTLNRQCDTRDISSRLCCKDTAIFYCFNLFKTVFPVKTVHVSGIQLALCVYKTSSWSEGVFQIPSTLRLLWETEVVQLFFENKT